MKNIKHFFCSFLICLAFTGVSAQKLVKKSIVNPEIEGISINVTQCFLVKVNTTNQQEIKLIAHIEGEYKNDLILQIKEVANNLEVTTDFAPNFVPYNDKLSAHKVISIFLEVFLPEKTNLSILGTNAKVAINGNYSNLNVLLMEGECLIDVSAISGKIKTQSGNIEVSNNTTIQEAKTKFGRIINDPENRSTGITLVSNTGNILFQKKN